MTDACPARAWPAATPDDPLWRAAQEARNAVHGLQVMAHYAGCRSRVGR